MTEEENRAVRSLKEIAGSIYDQIDSGKVPKMTLPLRTKSNIRFDPKHGVFKYGKATAPARPRRSNGALMLLRTMYVLEFIEDMVQNGKSSTPQGDVLHLRGLGEGQVLLPGREQHAGRGPGDRDACMREDFKLRAEENGASIIGDLTISEMDRKGKVKRINCRDDVGDSGYGIPNNVEREKVQLLGTNAKFVVAIETGGMFDRLVENGFDERYNAVLVHLKGQPARSTRRFISA